MREHAAYGLSPAQAQRVFSGILKASCLMENEPGGPVEGTEAGRRGPSEPVQVVSTISAHEGRGASPSSPRLEDRARSNTLPSIRTGTYTHGALIAEIKRASAFMAPDNYTAQKRVRAGRTGTGHLPSVPEVNDRIVEGTFQKGDVERMLKVGAPSSQTPLAVLADETQEPEVEDKPGRASNVMDYATRAAVGAGIGRTLGFLARGALSEAAERRLGIGGAMTGLALAEASRREAKRIEEAKKQLRQMAESERGSAASGQPLRTADEQIRSMLESGARAEGVG